MANVAVYDLPKPSDGHGWLENGEPRWCEPEWILPPSFADVLEEDAKKREAEAKKNEAEATDAEDEDEDDDSSSSGPESDMSGSESESDIDSD